MKKNWFIYLISLILLVLFTSYVSAQRVTGIRSRCQPPNTSVYGSVQVSGNGDVFHTPCPTRSSIFTGIVDFSDATLTGTGGFVTGSGTLNFIPRFTGATALGDTPFSWNGTTYAFNNTALNSEFRVELVPNSTTGTWFAGDVTGAIRNYFRLNNSTGFTEVVGENNLNLEATNLDVTITTAGGVMGTFSGATNDIFFEAGTGGPSLFFNGSSNLVTFASQNGINLGAGTGAADYVHITSGALRIGNDCAGTVTLDGSGQADLSTTTCFANITTGTKLIMLTANSTGANPTGIFSADNATGAIQSSSLGADASVILNYWIIARP